MKKEVYIITAAGGNATAIQVLAEPKSRADYAKLGRLLIAKNQDQKVEQVGFLILSQSHFEMSGAEFCGNAARAAAILFSRLRAEERVEFTMSGFAGVVRGEVKQSAANKFYVECLFPNLPLKTDRLSSTATLVDLGGIIHVVMEDDFPKDNFAAEHLRITKLFNLSEREAVGVVWARKRGLETLINPVVWVKAVNSFFYESSCGSGSIAAARVLGVKRIVQPTGESIEVIIDPEAVTLKSEMEVTNGFD